MAHKRKRIFDGLYAQLEETDGNVVLFSARGEPSVIFEITNRSSNSVLMRSSTCCFMTCYQYPSDYR